MTTMCCMIGLLSFSSSAIGAEDAARCDSGNATVSFESQPGKLEILCDGQAVATYYYRDEKITRPYFAHVRGPGGVPLTRNHPPDPAKDAADHAELHPGIWLAFGDLSGADNWRNKARVRHERFVEHPHGGAGNGTFAVENHYLAADDRAVICRETCRYTILVRPYGYLLDGDSVFQSDEREFSFGDQEEMGLGIRVATALTVRQGGRILTADGRKNERQVRGQQSAWCDYSGTIAGRRAGITLMPHPSNFRPAWYHARDYGFVAANPFGRRALTGGPPSQVVVQPGETFRLRFGVLLHSSSKDEPVDLVGAYDDYVDLSTEK